MRSGAQQPALALGGERAALDEQAPQSPDVGRGDVDLRNPLK
jgi:hypothetical protein